MFNYRYVVLYYRPSGINQMDDRCWFVATFGWVFLSSSSTLAHLCALCRLGTYVPRSVYTSLRQHLSVWTPEKLAPWH